MKLYLENILFASVLFFPYMLFAYYPLRYFKRFDLKKTILLEVIASVVEIIFFVLAFQYFEKAPALFVAALVIFNPLAYKLIYKVNFGRILFNLLMIVNYANFTVVFAKFLEILLFPQMSIQNFHWSFSICVLITELIFLAPIAYLTKRYSDDMIKDNSIDFIWRFIWVLPLLFSILGVMTFYQPSYVPGQRLHFYINSSIFCAIIVYCQLLVYYCIARIVRQQQLVRTLEKDVYHHSLQKVQYKHIEEQIKDTRILRHDLRHHVTLMCQYVDQGNYEKLKTYLHQYSHTINQISQLHYTDNSVLNALLVYYADLCRSQHIEFDVKIYIPKEFPLSDSESTTVLGNLLENAYQACLDIEEVKNRKISIIGRYKANNYLFVIRNTYCNMLNIDSSGNFTTTKENGNGIGIVSVKEIIHQHQGYIHIDTDNHCFEVNFAIPK